MVIKYTLIITFICCFLSCKNNSKEHNNIEGTAKSLYKRTYNDDFENGIQSFWKAHQFVSKDRYGIVEDPLNPDNKVMRIDLKKGDRIAGGYRGELVIKSNDSFGYKNKLSFKFLLPKSFYKKEDKKGIIVIQQWHDEPYPGFTWATNKNKLGPPQGLYFEHSENGEWTLVFKSGLKAGKIYEVKLGRYFDLKPDVWHSFSLETFWSLYNKDGYFMAKVNGNCFTYDKEEKCKLYQRNMYHTIPNYYKMGLYQSGSQEHDRHIFYDDFKMTTKRTHYVIPNT